MFINSLDVDYTKGFSCPICSQLPAEEQILVMDGKTMGLCKERMPVREEPLRTGIAPTIHASSYTYLAGDKKRTELRAKLRHWAKGEGCSNADFADLQKQAERHAPELFRALQYITHNHDEQNRTCPSQYRQFFLSIATSYPIPSLIPPLLSLPLGGKSICALKRIMSCTCISLGDKDLLQRCWPAFYEIVKANKWTAVPQEFHPLLDQLITLASFPGICKDTDHLAVVQGLPNKENLVYMPNHPVCRPLRQYNQNSGGKASESCRKDVTRCSGLTPGIFTFFCPHGVCLGFSILERYEGPSTAFELLFQRFPTAPRMVIYDNACNLSKYCLLREPAFFAKTEFRIDRLHWKGHIGCHEGFCLDAYPKDIEVLGGKARLGRINSQVCEQANSGLDYISKQAKFMRLENFLAHTRLFLYSRNVAKIEKITS